jgi:hypothetical protein
MLLIDELMIEYAKRFKNGFPSYQIMSSHDEGETIDIIKECLEKNKDAYQLGYVTDNEDTVY